MNHMAAVRSLVQTGQWQQALESLRQMARASRDPDVLIHLSYAESKCGSHAAAELAALCALDTRDLSPQLLLQLMNRLRHFNLSDPLRHLIESSSAQRFTPAGHHSIGAHLSFLGEQDAAARQLDKCLEIEPANTRTLLARGQIRMFAGNFEGAAADLEACVTSDPKDAQAWWSLAQLGVGSKAHREVGALEATLSALPARAPERAYLAYALHKVHDDLSDLPAAIRNLETGRIARRAEQPYNSDSHLKLLDSLLEVDLRSTVTADAAPSGFTPVFVVGMFRSGTTLLEQLLSAHPDVSSAGELRDFGTALQFATDHHCRALVDAALVSKLPAVDADQIGRRYLQSVAWRARGRRILTDKMPANFMLVGEILRAIPHARILHMVRDPMATCFSNFRELFSGVSPYSYDQIELADYFAKYRDVMTAWHIRYPGRIQDVPYDALTRDTGTVMREVASFCGLDFHPGMTDTRQGKSAVATASVVQVRGSVQSRKTEKWVAYADYLSPLRNRLEAAALPGLRAG